MNYQNQLLEILKKHTKKETAQLLGISENSISNYVSNRTMPILSIVEKIHTLHEKLYKGDSCNNKGNH